MHQVELPPFPGSKGTEHRVVGEGLTWAETRITIHDHFIHPADIFKNLSLQLLNGRAAWQNPFRRLASGWKESERDNQTPLPLFTFPIGTGAEFARCQTTFKIFDCTQIAEI